MKKAAAHPPQGGRLLRDKRLFLFDLDGVFYRGKEDRLKLGGETVLRELREKGKQVLVLTNDSTDSVETIRSRLTDSGIRLKSHEILSSARLTAEFIREHHGSVTYFLVGERGLETEMRKAGHRRTFGDRADMVVVGLDRSLTYEKLDHAARLLRGGARLIATHSARVYMYRTGPAIATGPIVKALEFGGGKQATTIGKPALHMFQMALKRARCSAKEAVMIGDQVDTDIAGAAKAGIDAILVTSGVDKDARGFKVLATVANVDEVVRLL